MSATVISSAPAVFEIGARLANTIQDSVIALGLCVMFAGLFIAIGLASRR